ncbi:hypothetical protein [Crateriforma spongiae]|uniref:hypothetical protein n=1 Tax=Crateriforma spongiae TaxID=2724528 RepID=UPI0014461383|nr:hypothetical protein [Crateriforma spongiae]
MNTNPYEPNLSRVSDSPSIVWLLIRWRTIPTLAFGLLGCVGLVAGIWFTAYFYYSTFAYEPPLIYPDNYKPLVRWPALIAIAVVCLRGALCVWRGRYAFGSLLAIGSYFAAMGLFYAIDNFWN